VRYWSNSGRTAASRR